MKLQIENLVKLQDLDKEISDLLGNNSQETKEESFDFEALDKLDEMRKTRTDLAETIDHRLVRYYERLRSSKGEKMAVVPVINAICQGCYIAVPTATAAKLVRKDSIATCDHCGRFIYSA